MPVKDTLKGLKGLIFNADEDEDEEEAEEKEETEGEKDYQEVSNRNLNMKEADMLLFDPRSFEECTAIAKHLIKDKVCIVNIRRLNEGAAQRLLD
ncbi:MAG: cell division protein SepF, partial [Erysipelotrichaceae bacterium]|nr:cell division protein SepF [Erysipelotrichaceae bacterium]